MAKIQLKLIIEVPYSLYFMDTIKYDRKRLLKKKTSKSQSLLESNN